MATQSVEPIIEETVSFDPVLYPKAAMLLNAALSGLYRIIVVGGAVRGGKSFGVGGVIFMLQQIYAYSRAIVVRDTLQNLRDTTLTTVDKLIPSNAVKRFRGDPQFEWTYKNGSVFKFFSEQDEKDPEKKRWNGLEVNYIWLEQVEEIQESTYIKALERLGSYMVPKHLGQQPKSILFMTVNPTDTWVRKQFYDPWVEGLNGTGPGLPDNVLFLPMNIHDNGGLHPDYLAGLELLKRTNPIKYKRFVEGRWDVKEKEGGEWYWGFEWGINSLAKEQFGVPFLPELIGDVHLTYDFNTVPFMTMLCFQIAYLPNLIQIRFFKEYCLKNPDNRTVALCEAVIRDYLSKHPKNITYHGDRQGENRVEGEGNFRRFDRVRATLAPYIHNKSNGVNKAVVVSSLTRDFVNECLRGFVPGIQIIIDEEKCPTLVADIANTKEENNRPKIEHATDSKTNVRYEKNGHCLSAFTYGVVSALFTQFLLWKKTYNKLGE